MAQRRLEVHIRTVTHRTLADVEPEWLAIEARTVPPPYLTFAWLKSWAEIYRPQRLRLLRVVDHDNGVIGLGLVEELPLRRMRFAGAPVTPIRGMLCSPGCETRTWDALEEWIASGRCRYGWLGATGIQVSEDALAGAVSTRLRWFSVDLPGTFDEYFASLGSSTQRKRRRELRLADREGVVTMTLPRESAAEGLAAFVRLHQARAQSKGEVHPVIDQRLLEMLRRVLSRRKPHLQVNVVERKGTTLAAAICLYDDNACWGYNTGFDPSAAHLSPGILVHLQEIRAAIERGSRRCDLGEGEHAYKRYLGGKPVHRVGLEFTSPSAAGRVMRWAVIRRQHAAQNSRMRAAADFARHDARLRAAAIAARRSVHLDARS